MTPPQKDIMIILFSYFLISDQAASFWGDKKSPPPPEPPRKRTAHEMEIESLKMELENEKRKTQELGSKVKKLKEELKVERFGVARFGYDDKTFKYFTGFENINFFLNFFNWIEPKATNMQRYYYQRAEAFNSKAGRPSCMLLVDELFMLMCRMRLGHQEMDLAVRFNCSVSTVSRKLITWINLLYFVFGSLKLWLSRADVDKLMPQVFKEKYPSTRVIIDCTEIKCQVPKSLILNSQLFSAYKSSTTFKGLIGIAPSGQITFVSTLYTGAMSDVEITSLCGLLDLLEVGDSVMADKGFKVYKMLKERDVSLNIPPFLSNNSQFSVAEVAETQDIAALRIHVERAIERVKRYKIFSTVIPLTLLGSINQLWAIATILANLKNPLIRETRIE